MRILHLSPRFPFPEDDGGKISIAADLKMFAANGCQVEFVTFADSEIPANLKRECERYCKLHIIQHSTKNTPLKIAKSLLHSQSLYIHKHISPQVKNELRQIIENTADFDVIHCEHSAMAPLGIFAAELTGLPVGIRLQNVEYKIWQRYADGLLGMNPKAMYIRSQAKKVRRDEAHLYQEADICFAITDIDKKAAQDIAPRANLLTATAGIFPDRWKPRGIKRNAHQLVIATTYNWIHNIHGLEWFFENVLPTLKERFPDLSVSLIGKNPPEHFYRYAHLGVEVLGYVPHVQTHLNKAGIYIAPLFTGSGIRIKILEAMAMELPVVATHVSAEGIKANERNGLFISDNAEDWIATISRLCQHPQNARTAGETARKRILSRYTWDTNVQIMIDAYKRLSKKR